MESKIPSKLRLLIEKEDPNKLNLSQLKERLTYLECLQEEYKHSDDSKESLQMKAAIPLLIHLTKIRMLDFTDDRAWNRGNKALNSALKQLKTAVFE